MRIAFIGGASYDAAALASFLWKLKEKHPTATIVTGSGSPSEKQAAEGAALLGFRVEVPAVHPEWFMGDTDAASRWQINDVFLGADIVVVIGGGGRPERALELWHLLNLHERNNRGGLVKRDGKYVSHRTTPIQLHEIAHKQAVAKAA